VNFGVREPNLESYVGDAAVNIAELGEVQQADSMLGIVECKGLHNFKIRDCATRLKGRSYRGGVDGNCTAVQAVREFPVAKISLALLTRIKKDPDPAWSCNVSNRWDAAVGDSSFMVGLDCAKLFPCSMFALYKMEVEHICEATGWRVYEHGSF
jgi:hypothetical protein